MFTVIGLALIVFHTVKRRKSLKQIVISRMVRSVLLIRRNMGVAAAFVLILVPVSLNFTSSDVIMEIFNEKEGYESTLKIGEADYEKYSRYEEYGLKDNFDTIRMIYDDASWTALTMEEKKEVIIKICYCECRYLGIDCDVNLVFTDELEEEIGGLYDDSNRTIYYNNISLEKDNEDAFLVIAEEVFHCYQHELARLYVKLSPAERNLLCFEKCEGWLKNMDSYIAGGETEEEYIAYRTQPLEKDAKKYAYDSWGDYQYEIEILLNERNKEKDT